MASKTGLPLKLIGRDGNAFYILGSAVTALKAGGKADLVEEFKNEAMAGDYNHLLATCNEWFEVK